MSIRRERTTANNVQGDYWTRFYYDGLGRTSAITYPNGMAVGYGYADGQLKAMTFNIGGTVGNVVTWVESQAFGPAISWVYGNGLRRGYTYDLDRRLTTLGTYNGASLAQKLSYAHNTADDITQVANAVNSNLTQNFGYDGLSRLTGFTSPSGNQSFYYDANGNETRHVWTRDEGVTVDANSNRISAMTSHGYNHDSLGNRTTQSWGARPRPTTTSRLTGQCLPRACLEGGAQPRQLPLCACPGQCAAGGVRGQHQRMDQLPVVWGTVGEHGAGQWAAIPSPTRLV